jgi:hypothetical protein
MLIILNQDINTNTLPIGSFIANILNRMSPLPLHAAKPTRSWQGKRAGNADFIG